jgi:hypothetical protein
MISSEEIVSCEQIEVASDEPAYIDFSLKTEIFDGDIKSVTIRISSPKVKSEVVLSNCVVKIFDSDGQEVKAPPAWSLATEIEKTLRAFIAASYPKQKVVQEAPEDRTEMAIKKIEKNLDTAADFVAKTLFFYIKGLSPDDIDRAKASFIGKITEKIIHYRNITNEHARRKNNQSDVILDGHSEADG